MSLIKSFINKKNEFGYQKAIHSSVKFLTGAASRRFFTYPYHVYGLLDYHFNPNALKQSKIEPFIDKEKIRKEFIDNGFEVIDYHIDKADFIQWLHEVNFPKEYSNSCGEVFTEKALEHYLSSRLLDLNENDVFVDIAAASSPWYDLSEKRYNCRTFAVDLHLPFKNDPRLIECDATDMPFDNESISKIALHCAYEMFENDADINLINEANRVLRKGGKMIIIPLYMDHIQSSPKVSRKGIVYGKARRVWRDDKYSVRFSRHYSVEAFKERIVDNRDKLNLKIYYFTNENEIKQNLDDRVYVKFAACFTKE